MVSVFEVLHFYLIEQFNPFWFVTVVGTGISSTILHSFFYEIDGLRFLSYVMFGIACNLLLIMLALLFANMLFVCKRESFESYFNIYFQDSSISVFWGLFPMGLGVLTNYIFQLCDNELNDLQTVRGLVLFVYILWWIDIGLSLTVTWGVTFLIWRKCSASVTMENIPAILLLTVIPSITVSSSGGTFTMSELLFTTTSESIQTMTLFVTCLIWFSAFLLTIVVLNSYIWNLYVNKIPPFKQVFTIFIQIGPFGQASFGFLLLTNNIKKYIELYYPVSEFPPDDRINTLAVICSFKVCGALVALFLIAAGILFTIISVLSVISYSFAPSNSSILAFHKGWWAMPFPLGTMALATEEFYRQYGQYVSAHAFHVLGVIYGFTCSLLTIFCLAASVVVYSRDIVTVLNGKKEDECV